MRIKSVLLGFVAAGAIVLSAGAATFPASAAPVTSVKVPSSALASGIVPNGEGSLICSGDLCIQRVTSIVNHEATIKAWASYRDFVGHFQLSGPDGTIANSHPDKTWIAGGDGYYFQGVAQGSGYTITAWEGDPEIGWHDIGQIPFGV